MNLLSLNIRGVGVPGKEKWVRDLRKQHEVGFLMLQEIQHSTLDGVQVEDFWGQGDFGFDWVKAEGRSGGLMSFWDKSLFTLMDVVKSRYYMLIVGKVKGSGEVINMVNLYAPQNTVKKRRLWAEIISLLNQKEGFWMIAGDFNVVRSHTERKNSLFNSLAASDFNSFIEDANLHEYGLKGRQFTFVSGEKMSRIDRVLVCWNYLNKWPNAEYRALCREKSDHSPLILKVISRNFGPKPFRFFNSWLDRQDFKEVVVKSLEGFQVEGDPDTRLMLKFKRLRQSITSWKKELKDKESEEEGSLKNELNQLELVLEDRSLSEVEVWVMEETKRRLKTTEVKI